ncbi:MAG: BCCT family transporter, partial [Clostridia bacterium]
KPKYTFFQWFAMSLCGGIAIGIVFWGVAEPIIHLSSPALGIEPYSGEAVMFSISTCYLHWSITPYALYNLATIPIALAVYNYHQKLSISSGLYFLMGEKCHGGIGKFVDAISLFALVGGIATSLGMGIMQVASGVGFLGGISASPLLWLIIAVVIVVAFTASSALGMDKGLKWLADQNIKLYGIVLLFILIVGPTAYICKLGFQGMGEFATTFFAKSTYLGVDTGEDWARWWSIFYWAAWIAYAPVVGVFLTRLCYGRTVRQFLVVNLLGPAMFGILWFTIFGGTAMNMQLSGAFDFASALAANGTESAVFAFFSQMPLGTLLVVVFLVIIMISFVTMADSMTSVAAILSTGDSGSEEEPPLAMKLIWGIIMGALAYVMITFAGIDGTKMLATLASFPLLFLMVIFIVSMLKGLYAPNSKWITRKKKAKSETTENQQ